MDEFSISSTASIASLSIYVFALALGPILGSPLSETVGRYPVYMTCIPLAALFILGTALTHSFAALCVLRFLAGFCFAPSLAIATGTINETYHPAWRAIPSTIFILMPFLGPALGPVIGSFATSRMGWRWTQWALLFFSVFAIALFLFAEETYHPVIRRRRLRKLGLPLPPVAPLSARVRTFATVALFRPVHMLLTEPIVGLICLYVACEFATLFSFFAVVPYIFQRVYHFGIEQQGLVFLSIAVGCLLGTITVILCNALMYAPKTKEYPAHQTPPEYRLYPAMIGSIGLPLGLFWFGWTSRSDISWASPVAAIVPFSWGNLCLFVSTIQYLADVYSGSNIASAAGANSLARYGLAGAFPLFSIQSKFPLAYRAVRQAVSLTISPVYQNLGIGWATSLLGFIALALLPVPWAFFRYGKSIRARSSYETAIP